MTARHVAAIRRIPKAASGYNAAQPWALLHNDGKSRTFGLRSEAVDEARKVYPACRVTRSGDVFAGGAA